MSQASSWSRADQFVCSPIMVLIEFCIIYIRWFSFSYLCKEFVLLNGSRHTLRYWKWIRLWSDILLGKLLLSKGEKYALQILAHKQAFGWISLKKGHNWRHLIIQRILSGKTIVQWFSGWWLTFTTNRRTWKHGFVLLRGLVYLWSFHFVRCISFYSFSFNKCFYWSLLSEWSRNWTFIWQW